MFTLSNRHNHSFFLISDFLSESLKANKNYLKRWLIAQYSFAQKISPILQPQLNFCSRIETRRKNKNKTIMFSYSCICIYLIEVSCLSTVTFRNLSWKCFKRGKIFIQQDFKITQNFQTISSKQYPAKDFHFFVGM